MQPSVLACDGGGGAAKFAGRLGCHCLFCVWRSLTHAMIDMSQSKA